MWKKSYSQKISLENSQLIWSIWCDVNNWPQWQDDLEFSKLKGPLQPGSTIEFKPKGGPRLTLKIVTYEEGKVFTDLTQFPFAKMYDQHELIKSENGGYEIKTTISIEGPLSFIWRKIVAENIVKGLPLQTEKLIKHIGSLNEK